MLNDDVVAARLLRLRHLQRRHLLRPTACPQLDGGRTVDRSGRPWPGWPSASAGSPAFRDSTAPETLGLLRDHALQDWRDVVRRFPLPLLMLAGRESQVWSCEHAEAAVAGTPRGRALVIEDAGHAISIDQPDVFNDAAARLPRRGRRRRPDEARDAERARRRSAPGRARPRARRRSGALWRGLTERIVADGRHHRDHGRPARPRRERPVRRLQHRRRSPTTSSRPCRPGSTSWSATPSAARCSSAPSPGWPPRTRSTSTPASGSASPREGLKGRLFWATAPVSVLVAGLAQKWRSRGRATPSAAGRRAAQARGRRRFDMRMAIGVFRDVAHHPVAGGRTRRPVDGRCCPTTRPPSCRTRWPPASPALGWDVRRLPGVGHDFWLEDADRTFAAVRDVLARSGLTRCRRRL